MPCKYKYTKNSKTHRKGEECGVMPRGSGKWCAKNDPDPEKTKTDWPRKRKQSDVKPNPKNLSTSQFLKFSFGVHFLYGISDCK